MIPSCLVSSAVSLESILLLPCVGHLVLLRDTSFDFLCGKVWVEQILSSRGWNLHFDLSLNHVLSRPYSAQARQPQRPGKGCTLGSHVLRLQTSR